MYLIMIYMTSFIMFMKNANMNYIMGMELTNYLSDLFNLMMKFKLDYVSKYCLFMLLTCFFIASLFYWHYFNWHSDYLMINIQMFVSSMLFLIYTNSSVNSFMGWEYLSMSSFFLILYYSMYCSARSALMTVMSSRLGDMGFFIFMGFISLDLKMKFIYGSIFMCFLLMSKTAVYPMSSWLLEAMRAPTPVSSLVHSSTLVASGVWLLSRYEGYLLKSNWSIILLSLSCMSVMVSSSCAFFYSDSKKIIALSTCNNISWCYMYIYSGMTELGLMQLVSHGMFKCLMFCLMGDLLMKSNNSQNKKFHYMKNSNGFNLIIVLMSLFISGLPFMGVYFSKHLFMSFLSYNSNLILLFLMMFGMGLSFLYTFRLMSMLTKFSNKSSEGFNKGFYLVCSMLPVKVIIKSFLSESMLEESLLSLTSMMIINSLMFMLSYLGYNYILKSEHKWNSGLLGQDYLISLSLTLEGMMENMVYLISVWRWEYFTMNYFMLVRNNLMILNYNYMFTFSLMFYLMLLFY